jgi:Predicted membrane protein
MKETIRTVTKGTFKKIIDPYYVGGAAELSFWLMLSLMPATIILAQILQLFTISMDAASNLVDMFLTDEIYDLISPVLNYKSSDSITIILIVLALWAGSTAVFTMMRISNRAYGFVPKSGPVVWMIAERLRSMLFTLIVLVTLVFALYILVYGEMIVRASLSYNNVFMGTEYTFSEVWFAVRWIIAFILFFLMAFSIYLLLPRAGSEQEEAKDDDKKITILKIFYLWMKKWMKNRGIETKRALPGTFFSAISMLIVTWAYTLYIEHLAFDNINILYGGLSSVVVLLLWFYIMSYIFITGIQINATCVEYGITTKEKLDD